MTQNEVIEVLSSLSIGTVISWGIVIAVIVGTIGGGFVKLYKFFEKSKEIKDENDEFKTMVRQHEEQLKMLDDKIQTYNVETNQQLKEIKDMLLSNKETKIKELRHSIVRAGEEAVRNNTITIRSWKSLHEMYDEYVEKYHQNSYVSSLINKVDKNVEIVGQLNEHGEEVD